MENRNAEDLSIVLNGKETILAAGTTISQFLADRSLQDKLVVVEINGVIVSRSEFHLRRFSPADVVEVVHFVGGG